MSSVRWGDLGIRVASAAVLVPLALFCIWKGGAAFAALVGLAAAGLAAEWVRLCGMRLASPGAAVAAVSLLLAGAATLAGVARLAPFVLAAGTLLTFLAAGRGRAAGRLAAGLPYIGLGGFALLWLRRDGAAGLENVLVLVLVVWASDIGAYAFGRLIGGVRLAPSISPGKTVSGAIGGLASAVSIGTIAAYFIDHTTFSFGWVAFVALLLGIVSQAGDLLESWIKRQFGVKDSGHLIPGHGGLLDRLDGLLAAAPAGALLALAAGPGVVLWR